MSPEIIAIVGGIIGAIAAFITTLPVLIPYLRERRNRDWQEFKYAYIKIVHLTRRGGGNPPVYRAWVRRLDQAVDVYDEYHYFRLNIFRSPRESFACKDRSSGVVDLQILHPWNEEGKLVFPDVGSGKLPHQVEQTIQKNSNVFFTKSIYYNGLQEGNEDLAMRMEHDTREARLIVDFSSIPDCDVLVPMPAAVECIGERQTEISARKLAPGIYSVSGTNVRKDTVLRLDFRFAWEAAEGRLEAPATA